MIKIAVFLATSLFCNFGFANGVGWPDLDSDICDQLERSDPTDAKESDFDMDGALQRLGSFDAEIKYIVSIEMKKEPPEEDTAEWLQYGIDKGRAKDSIANSIAIFKGTLLRYNTLLMRERYLSAHGQIKSGLKGSYERSKKLFCDFVKNTRWPS